MTFYEVESPDVIETTRQRWSQVIVAIFAVSSIIIAFNLRNQVLGATSTYVNNEVGITAIYPQNWLLDETSDNYIFQVQDIQAVGYKTVYRVNTLPVGADTELRTLIDTLAVERAQTLAAYRTLAVEPFTVTSDITGRAVTYTFVETSSNPFVQTIPIVVVGVDVLFVSRGQAIVITLLSKSDDFQPNFDDFLQFVRLLEF